MCKDGPFIGNALLSSDVFQDIITSFTFLIFGKPSCLIPQYTLKIAILERGKGVLCSPQNTSIDSDYLEPLL